MFYKVEIHVINFFCLQCYKAKKKAKRLNANPITKEAKHIWLSCTLQVSEVYKEALETKLTSTPLPF